MSGSLARSEWSRATPSSSNSRTEKLGAARAAGIGPLEEARHIGRHRVGPSRFGPRVAQLEEGQAGGGEGEQGEGGEHAGGDPPQELAAPAAGERGGDEGLLVAGEPQAVGGEQLAGLGERPGAGEQVVGRAPLLEPADGGGGHSRMGA